MVRSNGDGFSTAEMIAKHRDAVRAVDRAERLVLDFVARDPRRATEAFSALKDALSETAPPPRMASGEWVVRPLESFAEEDVGRSPRGKWICPLCGNSYWGRENLARHMESPHGVCPEPGCGQVITAAGLASHRYGRHEKKRAAS
jgi:rubrerythrin